ncbi:MAG: 3-deoxy-7-phosphoheptulonate synthase [Planctomycetota bacterium]|jgi:3-deoxy-7-phosphoheptulonate synthase
MLVVMKPRCPKVGIDHVVQLLDEMGADHCVLESSGRTVVEVLHVKDAIAPGLLESEPLVEKVVDSVGPMLVGDRQPGDQTREIRLGANAVIGGRRIGVIAGPCSVETQGQLVEIAAGVKEAGAIALRGGAFKPRTSPYSFQGLRERGLEMLALAREETGLAIVTEVMSSGQVDLVAKYADMLQVGSRSMHCTDLLVAVGQQAKPVLLKRGWSATLQEFLMAAEYIMKEGNRNVILCERGIRTHETYVRNTLALAVVPEIKRLSRLPIIVDPSHGTGRRHLVTPMSNAAIAAGADGLLVEVHRAPDQAWCDGDQSLFLQQFQRLMAGLRPFADACGREV